MAGFDASAQAVVDSLRAESPGDAIDVWVNGKLHSVKNPSPDMTLLEFLRGRGLTGTKLGCGEVINSKDRAAASKIM